MDAGLAALLGAAVGSLATLGAAVVNGRATARSTFAQWRRQVRRDAYVGYLSALHDRDIAMDAILAAVHDSAEPGERVREFVELAREVHRAAEVVILEGPPEVTRACHQVGRASEEVAEVMRRLVAGASDRAADLALVATRQDALYDQVKGFRAAAGDVLTGASYHGRRAETARRRMSARP